LILYLYRRKPDTQTNKQTNKQTKQNKTKQKKTKVFKNTKKKTMSNITSKPLKPKNMDLKSLSFTSMKTMPSGARVGYANYDGNMLYIQSPELGISYDTGTYYPDNDNSGKYSVKTSMDNIKSNSNMRDFHDKLTAMDEEIINKGVECASEWFESLKWFKKKGSVEEKVRDNYTPMVKVSVDSETGEPNGKYPPGFAFKIVKRDGVISCDCYDKDRKELPTEGDDAIDLEKMFTKGTRVQSILKCNGLWASTAGWGCTWRAEQVKINSPMGFSGYAFDDSDDEDDGHALVRTDTVHKPDTKEESSEDTEDNYVDSDEESEEEEQQEETVVKRRVKN